jgi:hypothetical protein
MTPEQVMSEVIRRGFPGIKSQAQYDAAMNALESTKLVLNAIFNGNKAQEEDAIKALAMSIEVARRATDLTSKLGEAPEASTSPIAETLKNAPAQFQEQEIQVTLMEQLKGFTSRDTLNAWYARTKPERDKIVTQALRNELLDAIRAKLTQL